MDPPLFPEDRARPNRAGAGRSLVSFKRALRLRPRRPPRPRALWTPASAARPAEWRSYRRCHKAVTRHAHHFDLRHPRNIRSTQSRCLRLCL